VSPSPAPFKINYRVADLRALLQALRSEGCNVLDKTEKSEFGKFGRVMDPDGNKIASGSRLRGNEPAAERRRLAGAKFDGCRVRWQWHGFPGAASSGKIRASSGR
jgi:hypothetical protein